MQVISPNFAHRCIWVRSCADQLLGSKVEETCEYNIFVNILTNFSKTRSSIYLGSLHTLIRVKGQGHSRRWPENILNAIFQKQLKGVSASFRHRCIWVCRCADLLLGLKVKVTAYNDPKTGWIQYNTFVNIYIHGDISRKLDHVCTWVLSLLIISKVKVTVCKGITVNGSPCSFRFASLNKLSGECSVKWIIQRQYVSCAVLFALGLHTQWHVLYHNWCCAWSIWWNTKSYAASCTGDNELASVNTHCDLSTVWYSLWLVSVSSQCYCY